MPKTVVLEALRQELAERLFKERNSCSPFDPLGCNRHIAASGLQKAIRRGDEKIALRCAARILDEDPQRLWRRLPCIAFEDIGIADVDLAGQITAVSGKKRWRNAHGGEWYVASHLIRRMCAAEKDRTSDELVHLSQFDPALTDHRRCWRSASIERLQEFIGDPTLGFGERALAVWYAIGTSRYGTAVLPERKGFPDSVSDVYQQMGVPDTIVVVSRSAQCSSIDPLSALLPLIWIASRHVPRRSQSDVFSTVRSIGEIPSYAIDRHTRTGKRTVSAYLRSSSEMRALLEPLVPKKQWPKIVEWLLFKVEGGLCASRLRWDLGDELRRQSERCVPGLPYSMTEQALEQLRKDLPIVNSIRAEVVRNAAPTNGLFDEA